MSQYATLATSMTPALIIYLLDVSASMNQLLGDKRRIDVVSDALTAAMRQMIFRSGKGSILSPRYHIAMYAYSSDVFDIYGGIKKIDEAARLGIPKLTTMNTTNTAQGFAKVEDLLLAQLEHYQKCPAPLVCHMTDGEYNGNDPQPIAERIMQMSVDDGPILLENIFISDSMSSQPIRDPYQWPGILPGTKLSSAYARKLKDMSSEIPDSYRVMMLEMNYHIASGARMLLPGISSELVAMGFQMSTATPVR